MVRAVRRRLQCIAVAACLTGAESLCGQDAGATSLPALQDAAVKRTAEWNTLTSGLELRLARLLPCDPRVRTAIEETGRASDVRTGALIRYWNLASARSKAQIEAVQGLLKQEEQRTESWAKETTEAQQESDATSAQAAVLKTSLTQVPALSNPQKSLESIAENEQVLQRRAQERETSASQLLGDLRTLVQAGQARQSAIDDQTKSVSAEGQRWSAYYAARQARAQIECLLVNPAAAARPLPQGKKP
jgi:membrane-bound lytic murein transglycosylase